MVVSSERPRISNGRTVRWECDEGVIVRTLEVLRVLLVDEVGEVTTVVKDHVERLAALERRESLVNAP